MLLWHWLNWLIKQLILLNKQINMKALPVQVVLFYLDSPFLISQCYNDTCSISKEEAVVAPFLISQCYNHSQGDRRNRQVVAPFLISQCYNHNKPRNLQLGVVAPFLISQCYNTTTSMKLLSHSCSSLSHFAVLQLVERYGDISRRCSSLSHFAVLQYKLLLI